MMSTEKIGKLKYKIALITTLAALALSVLVLADVIYYYRGVITATVSKPLISFFQGPNGYAPPYVVTTPTSTGFNLVIQITNASYAYYYEVLGLNAYNWCWLYVTNVTATPTLISNMSLYIQTPQNQTHCILPVIYQSAPYQSAPTPLPMPTYQSCTPGYWKNHATVPPWSSQYSPNATLGSVFTALNTYCSKLSSYTLLQALSFPSQGQYKPREYCGKVELLLVQAVAALENSLTMNYPLKPSLVITWVNSTISSGNETTVKNLQSYLDNLNEKYDYACSPGTRYPIYPPISQIGGCSLQPGTYYISVLVQPITPLQNGQSETISLYLACNVVGNESIPLPPVGG